MSTKLAAATHVITATYNGNSTFAASASNAVSLVVAPAPGDGPTVVHLARFGFHSLPTTLVLTFDKALDPASAQDPLNYTITNSQGHSIRIASVVYNPSTLTVTISPAARLNIHRSYHLTVVGTAPTGVTDTSGNLLDGALTGQPGSNYVATVTATDLVIPGRSSSSARARFRPRLIPEPNLGIARAPVTESRSERCLEIHRLHFGDRPQIGAWPVVLDPTAERGITARSQAPHTTNPDHDQKKGARPWATTVWRRTPRSWSSWPPSRWRRAPLRPEGSKHPGKSGYDPSAGYSVPMPAAYPFAGGIVDPTCSACCYTVPILAVYQCPAVLADQPGSQVVYLRSDPASGLLGGQPYLYHH